MTNKKRLRGFADKKNPMRTTGHLTRPPRLEGKVKEAMMQPVKKLKKAKYARAAALLPSAPAARESKPIPLIDKRIEHIIRKLRKFTSPRDASTFKCAVSVSKAIRHPRHGRVFRATVNLEVAGKLMSATADGETPPAALDAAYDEIKAEYTHFKDKLRSRTRREGVRMKEPLVPA